MRLLQAARVVRDGKAFDGVVEQAAEDRLRITRLRQKQIDRPHRIATPAAKLDEKHLAADKFVDLTGIQFTVISASIL
jgi:hypothetical protein